MKTNQDAEEAWKFFKKNNNVSVKEAQEKSGGATKDLLTIFCTKRTKKQFRKAAKTVGSLIPFIR